MAEIDRFKFEDKDFDFPFYNKNPYIPKWGWIVLFVALIIGMGLTFSNNLFILVLGSLVLILPLLYFLKWDYNAVVRNLSLRDIALVIALFVGYLVYAILMQAILNQFGIFGASVPPESVSAYSFVELIFAMIGEELMKFIPFLFLLRVLYKYTSNRKLSVIVSVAIIIIFFACLHAYSPIMLIFAILVQCFGSLFEFYGYLKTKNLLVSFLVHYLSDAFLFLMMIFGINL